MKTVTTVFDMKWNMNWNEGACERWVLIAEEQLNAQPIKITWDHLYRSKRKRSFQQPSTIPYINQVSCVNILGVVISNNLSVCGHVNKIITSSAQSVHVLHVLRSHGMSAECIRTIYRAVVIAKLTYVSSAWWGFTTAADRQRLEAVIRRGVHSGLCDLNQLALNELITDTDDKLFFQAMYNNCHVLNSILPNETHRTYNKLGSADITGHFLLNNTP